MSLDLLKERFGHSIKKEENNREKINEKLNNKFNSNGIENLKSQHQGEVGEKDKIIENLEIESSNLSNRVSTLTNDITNILQEINNTKWINNKVASTSQKIYEDKIKTMSYVDSSKLIPMLIEVSRKKQGLEKLNWGEWLEIPENIYLLQINENIAKKVFEDTIVLIDEAIGNINRKRTYGDAPDLRLLPLKISSLRGYYSSQDLSNTFSDGDDVTQWDDLSPNKNHFTQTGASHSGDLSESSGNTDVPEYNASQNSLLVRRNESNLDNMTLTNAINLSEFTIFFVVNFELDNNHQHRILSDIAANDNIIVSRISNTLNRLTVSANDGTTNVSSIVSANKSTNEAHELETNRKYILTCRKKPFNSDDGFGQVEWFINKISVGTNNDYDEDMTQKIERLFLANSSTGFKGHMYELAIYGEALGGGQVSQLQDYFIDRTNISV